MWDFVGTLTLFYICFSIKKMKSINFIYVATNSDMSPLSRFKYEGNLVSEIHCR